MMFRSIATLRPVARIARVPACTRLLGAKPPTDGSTSTAKFGRSVAAESSAAQALNDATRGRYEYIGDFVASMNKGPVKLEFGERAPSEKERQQFEQQEAALNGMKRSMKIGTLLAAGFCIGGWYFTKWRMGVKDVHEFSEAMHKKMPKVSGDMEDSMLGKRLKEQSAHSRDVISEDPELTAWRRSLRDKFNTPEGAALARQNSILMAERRKVERARREESGEINSSRPQVSEMVSSGSSLMGGAVVVAAEAEAGKQDAE